MLGNLLLAVVAFSFCGVVSAGIFHLCGSATGATSWITLTGIPFSLLCSALCVRPLVRAPIAAALQVLVWLAAYHTADRLFTLTHTSGSWPLLVAGVEGAIGVALAMDAARWRKPWGRLLAESAFVGLAGGAAFAWGGYAAGFIAWQGMVGTLLYARIQQSRPTV